MKGKTISKNEERKLKLKPSRWQKSVTYYRDLEIERMKKKDVDFKASQNNNF